jgi:hypothetical protein
MFNADSFKVNQIARFSYNGQYREGSVIQICGTYCRLQFKDGTHKSFRYNQMGKPYAICK